MARLPRNATEAVEALGISAGRRVLAFSPAAGWAEALSEAVGEGRVVVVGPPPDLEAPANVEVAESSPDAPGDVVLVWLGPVPSHEIREYPARVAESGTLWAVLPRKGRDAPAAVQEADVNRALLTMGWSRDRVVPLSTDSYAIRFRRRR